MDNDIAGFSLEKRLTTQALFAGLSTALHDAGLNTQWFIRMI